MKTISLLAAALLLTACASSGQSPHQSATFGPPSEIQGTAPATGMDSFKAMGNFGTGINSPQPSLPSTWNGGFRGY